MTHVAVRPPAIRARPAELVRRPVRDTPSRLLTALSVTVVALLALGVAGWQDLGARTGAAEQARTEARTLVRLQTAQTAIATADAQANNEHELGAAGSALQRQRYDYAVRRASLAIGLADRPTTADRVDLALAARWLTEYTSLVEAARTLDAADDPAAAGRRLDRAAALLEQRLLPELRAAQAASAGRLADRNAELRSAQWLFLPVALLALAALGTAQWWLARRTHRMVNPGLAAATVLALVATIAVVGAAQRSQSRAQEVREGPTAAADALVRARVGAFTALGEDGLGLAGGDDAAWQAAVEETRTGLSVLGGVPGREIFRGPLDTLLTTYQDAHAEVRRLVASGDRAAARERALSDATSGDLAGATGAFDALDIATAGRLFREQEAVDAGLARAADGLRTTGLAALLAALAAVALAWLGIARRLTEYR